MFGLALDDVKRHGQEEQRRLRKKHSSNPVGGGGGSSNVAAAERFEKKKAKRYQRELLGKLSQDLDYLEVLASDVKLRPGHGSAINDARGKMVKEEAEDAITFLKNRQLFWSQFKPMYSK